MSIRVFGGLIPENVVRAATDAVTGSTVFSKAGKSINAQVPSGRKVIIDTDLWTDCDDVAAIRIATWGERMGSFDVVAYLLNTTLASNPGSVDYALYYDGRKNNLIGVPLTSHVPSGSPAYQAAMLIKQHKLGYAPQCSDAVTVARTVLSAADNASIEWISLGFFTNIYELLLSAGDSISSLTGAQLFAAKVKKVWAMAGNWPTGSENNFTRSVQAKTAANYVLANSGTVPITFMGYEASVSATIGGNLVIDVAATDMLAKAFVDGGKTAGNSAFDTMLMYLAVIGDETTAGYTTVTGTAAVNASTGANSFTVGAGFHSYCVKAKADEWYASRINKILNLATQPKVLVSASEEVIPGFIYQDRELGIFQPSISVRAAAYREAYLAAWWHADDLAPLGDTTLVKFWPDRIGDHAFRQETAGSAPAYAASKESKNCVAFTSGKFMLADAWPFPRVFTAYIHVEWDVAPSFQTLLSSQDATPTYRSVWFRSVSTATSRIVSWNTNTTANSTAGPAATGAWQTIHIRRDMLTIAAGDAGAWAADVAIASAYAVSTALILGAQTTNGVTEPFVGWIREVRIYNEVHDTTQAAAVVAEMI